MTRDYDDDLLEELKDPEFAIGYINAILSDDDEEFREERFLLGLRKVSRAYGMSKLSEEAELNRQNLYKTLSETGNPELRTLTLLLKALGLRLAVAKDESQEEAS